MKNILIYHVGQLGDTLVLFPAINAIKAKYQNSNIILLTDKHSEKNYVSSWDVLKITPCIDQVIFYEPNKISKFSYIYGLIKELRGIKPSEIYNLVLRVNLKSKWRDHLFFKILFSSSKYIDMDVINYPPLKNNNNTLDYITPQWQRIVNKVGKDEKISKIQLPIHGESYKSLEVKLKRNNFNTNKLRIVIGPNSKMPSKCWPEESYLDLGFRLIEKYDNLELLIIGGSEDYQLADNLLKLWGMKEAQNYCGKLSIGESAELIRKCDIYIGNDTGVMHLAAMTGTFCLAIFSARDYPGLWEPFGDDHISIRKNIDCAGCILLECNEFENACLKLISVDEVFLLATKFLSSDG